MKSMLNFLKTTAAGGLVVVLPLLLMYLIVMEVLGLLVALATPIVDLFPEGTFGELHAPQILAVAILFGTSFLFGLLMRSSRLMKLGRVIDGKVISKVPAYRAVKGLTSGLLRTQNEGSFRTAILTTGTDTKEVVYVTEDAGGDWLTVLLPWAPASFAGSLRIVKRENVELVGVSLLDASASFANFGVGTLSLLERSGSEVQHSP